MECMKNNGWMLRFHGFRPDVLLNVDLPHVSLSQDPKLDWALKHRDAFPVDVNRAPADRLARVPGLTDRVLVKILAARRYHPLGLDDLRRLGAVVTRAQYFIMASDHNPALSSLDSLNLHVHMNEPKQLELFAKRRGSRPDKT